MPAVDEGVEHALLEVVERVVGVTKWQAAHADHSGCLLSHQQMPTL